MDAKTILAALVVLLLAITAVQAYQVSALNEKVNAAAKGSLSSIDGFSSYDEMMAAHHGGKASTGSSGAQQGIGGC